MLFAQANNSKMKNLIIFILILNFSCKSSESLLLDNNNFRSDLFPVKYGNLWAYADFYGNTKISAQFQEASVFKYGIAVVKQNNKYGYISNSGHWVIKPKYTMAQPFNLAYIRNKGRGLVQKKLIAKVNAGKGDTYVYSNGSKLNKLDVVSVGETHGIKQWYVNHSIENDDGSYELTYNYWRLTSDTTGYKVTDTTNLRLDTIIGRSPPFALLKKNFEYAIYNTEISRGIDVIKNERFIIPKESTHTIKPNFIYENIKFNSFNGQKYPSGIFKKDGKWGVPGFSEVPIVPFIYYDIVSEDKFSGYLVEFEKGKFGCISFVSDSNDKSKRVLVEHFKRE